MGSLTLSLGLLIFLRFFATSNSRGDGGGRCIPVRGGVRGRLQYPDRPLLGRCLALRWRLLSLWALFL
jgi:hypothetical protein